MTIHILSHQFAQIMEYLILGTLDERCGALLMNLKSLNLNMFKRKLKDQIIASY